MTRILLGQLGSNGDCLYATTLASQIKADYPGCHLTWAISSLAARVLVRNPDIDDVWEVPFTSWSEYETGWWAFEHEAARLAEKGLYDRTFLTQISPANFENYDGTIRPSMFRAYPRPVTAPVTPRIRLGEEERAEVDSWIAATPACDAPFVILFECSSKSGQSFMTAAAAVGIAQLVLADCPRAVVVICSHEPVVTDHPRIVSGHTLSMRHTAQLTHHAHLFVGCGSGLTVVATSDAARPNLPNVQILSRTTSMYASFRHDFEYFGLPNDHFLETTNEDPAVLARTIVSVVSEGLDSAKAKFEERAPLHFDWYLTLITLMLVERGKYAEAAVSLVNTADRYGWHPDLLSFARHRVAPFLAGDPRTTFPRRKRLIADFREALDLTHARG